MENIDPHPYFVLRLGGTPQARACAELNVSSGRGAALEARFRRVWASVGAETARPRFARHAAHVAAVKSAGGYPAIGR